MSSCSSASSRGWAPLLAQRLADADVSTIEMTGARTILRIAGRSATAIWRNSARRYDAGVDGGGDLIQAPLAGPACLHRAAGRRRAGWLHGHGRPRRSGLRVGLDRCTSARRMGSCRSGRRRWETSHDRTAPPAGRSCALASSSAATTSSSSAAASTAWPSPTSWPSGASSDVAVLERAYIGSGASGRNTAIIRSNYRTAEGVAFYDESVHIYERLSVELGFNVLFSPARSPDARPHRVGRRGPAGARGGEPAPGRRLRRASAARRSASSRPALDLSATGRASPSSPRCTTRPAGSSATTRSSGATHGAPTSWASTSTRAPR